MKKSSTKIFKFELFPFELLLIKFRHKLNPKFMSLEG